MAHEPVLLDAMLETLAPAAGETIVDATFGGGGYSRAILAAAPCRVIGIDRDPGAVTRGRALAAAEPRFAMLEGTFGELPRLLGAAGVAKVDGIVADLGVSSFQLDEAARGFSFQADGPLDMRMGGTGETAAELLARLDEAELARLLRELGDEPEAGRVARAIVRRLADRPITTTGELVAVVTVAKRQVKPGRSPATQVFQALRIAVNDELGELDRLLEAAPDCLAPGGRLVLVAFHSLEDRRIKRFIDQAAGRVARPSRHLPLTTEATRARLRWLERKVVRPGEAEVQTNPRARSARLRAAVKLAEEGEAVAHGGAAGPAFAAWRAAA
ncbi:MAG: 16S rRNA (cytosine(1402)-N(4))-methyltransferase RsmH [Geminicoccaceae bacterium]